MGKNTETSTKYSQPVPRNATAEQIFEYAELIAEKLNLKPGDDLKSVVKHLNGEIDYLEFKKNQSRHASIEVEKNGSFRIWLHPFLFPLEKRLSMAHELGHLFMHSRYKEEPLEASYIPDRLKKKLGEKKQVEYELVEYEADVFAHGLLMPTKMFKKALDDFNGDSIQIAAYFMVPEPAVHQRMIYGGF